MLRNLMISKIENGKDAYLDVHKMESIIHVCKIGKNICTDLLELMVLAPDSLIRWPAMEAFFSYYVVSFLVFSVF